MAAFRHASQGVTVRNFWLCDFTAGKGTDKAE